MLYKGKLLTCVKIIFAKNIGFCSGVKRAAAITERTLKEDPSPVQFLGLLVHNEKVIEDFIKKGVKFIKELKEAKSGTLIIQAHGRPPFKQEINSKFTIRDATCPLVKRAQLVAHSFFQKGCQVIILGDENHSEVIGIKGYTENTAVVVKDEKEAQKLPFFEKIGFLSQTTKNEETFERVLEILKKKTKELYWQKTLCPEVKARQDELERILKKCDGILLIGSRLSANTQRLAEKVKKLKKKLFWINSLEELKKQKINGLSDLGVISGTSTPNWEIEKIKLWLEEKQKLLK